jgi:imidazolonepropionase-like amidohydrolase
MLNSRLVLGTLLAASSLSLCFAATTLPQADKVTSGHLALVGATVYASPTEGAIRDGVVIVQDGKIAGVGTRRSLRIPQGARVIDCSTYTITAGFWNSHVHFLERKWSDAATQPASELNRQLQDMLTQYGFTSVFDTWSMWDNTRRLRDRIEAGEIAGPRIRSTGEATFPRGTGPTDPARQAITQATWGALGFMPLEKLQVARVEEPAEAVQAARTLLDAGTDAIKLYAVTAGRNGIALPDATIQALVNETHSRGKLVFAHPTTDAGLMAAVRAGADVLAHTTPQSGPWNERVLAGVKAAKVALIPTLTLWRYELRHERMSLADTFEETAVGQLRSWVDAAGVVLFGTDVGYMTQYDPTEEYVLMAKAGMTFPQILASLTTAPAERFGASAQTGRIATGYAADLTVLGHDPAKDIRALTAVRYTLRDGKIIFRAAR